MISNRWGAYCHEDAARTMIMHWSRIEATRIRAKFNRRMTSGTMRREVLHMRAAIRDQLRVSGKWLATDAMTMLRTSVYMLHPYGSARWAWKTAYREARIEHKREVNAFAAMLTASPRPGTKEAVRQAVRAIAGENAAIDFKFNSIIIYTDNRHLRQIADVVRTMVPMGIYIDVRRLNRV